MHRLTFFVSVAVAVLSVAPCDARAQRLPLLAAPEHYDLTFEPDLAAETFAGVAEIRARVFEPTDHLVLHAADLTIGAARIVVNGATVPAAVEASRADETVSIRLPHEIQPGLVELQLDYHGILNRQLRGFYISKANARKYAVTQLEATDARRMFPSFDEPDLKATFDITAIVDEGDTAISNGAVLRVETAPPGKKRIVFTTTAEMPTYLVALAVGDFECTAPAPADVPLRVCATPGNLRYAAFAEESASALLRYLNEYFAIDYPFAKLDLVAIPDFAAGAMENTGAIFFRESLLLVNPDQASHATRKRVALVIAHELAHQWFGNLVTMRWWDDLWLNEGFATWMEAKAVRAWKPDWQIDLDVVRSLQPALAIDALPSSRPVRVMAQTPDEINELFDPIAYEKGAAILRMIESYVGEEAFRGGINAYLERHAYDNATAENFWTVMTRASGRPVDRIMQGFVTRPGVPLLSIDAGCADGRTRIEVSQRRYPGGTTPAPAADTRPWIVPVCFRYPDEGSGDGDLRCELLDEARETFTIADRCVPWVVVNPDAQGYFRIAYDPADVQALAEATLTAAERLSLVADETALLRAGIRDADAYLRMAGAMSGSIESAAVLETLAGGLQYIREYFAPPRIQPVLESWVQDRFGPVQPRARPVSQGDRYRAAQLALLGAVGRDPEVLQHAHQAVDRYLAAQGGEPRRNDTAMDPTILNVLVQLAALEGGADLYERYRDRSEAAATPEERYRFLYALAQFRDPDLLRRTLEYALSPEVRTQDSAQLIARVLGNPAGREVAWRMLQARWPDLTNRYGAFGGVGRIVEGLGQFCSREAAHEIREFFETHPVSGAERTLEQTLERIRRCAEVAEHQVPELIEALRAFAPGDRPGRLGIDSPVGPLHPF